MSFSLTLTADARFTQTAPVEHKPSFADVFTDNLNHARVAVTTATDDFMKAVWERQIVFWERMIRLHCN